MAPGNQCAGTLCNVSYDQVLHELPDLRPIGDQHNSLEAHGTQAHGTVRRRVVGGQRQLMRRLVDETLRARFAGENGLCQCGCGALTRDGRRFMVEEAE